MDRRPNSTEYAPFYQTYVGAVPDGRVPALLEEQRVALTGVLSGVAPDRETYRYAEGKWSIREVVGHIVDTERVFAYRLLHFARAQTTALPGMDQDEFADASGYTHVPLPDILAEYRAQREATLTMLKSLDPAAYDRSGMASGVRFTVRALAYIITGHDRHHQGVLRARYLP